MARAALFALVALAAPACYSPSPASGAWLCGSDGNVCPDGTHCTCGQCVASDDAAACSFRIAVTTPGAAGDTPCAAAAKSAGHALDIVREHQGFTLSVTALTRTGTPATGFDGPVSLLGTWGDAAPGELDLASGAGTTTVTLDREVTPPQFAGIDVVYAGARTRSGPICVDAPTFVREGAPVVPPPAGATGVAPQPFGWADAVAGEPTVVRGKSGWRMYFAGFSTTIGAGIGVATSPDGRTFSPAATPIIPSDKMHPYIGSPSVLVDDSGTTRLAYAAHAGRDIFSPSSILLASSTDGLTGFVVVPQPLLVGSDCPFCGGIVDFPSLLAELDGSWSLFFNGAIATTTTIGRATAAELTQPFDAEPGPVLSGSTVGEPYLAVPRVILDGQVYKMFYTFIGKEAPPSHGVLCDADVSGGTGGIGYATSSDGNYWVRSPSNPILRALDEPGGWEPPGKLLIVGSVVPADGSDPASGLVLYYSPLEPVPVGSVPCAPSGVGRALAAGE